MYVNNALTPNRLAIIPMNYAISFTCFIYSFLMNILCIQCVAKITPYIITQDINVYLRVSVMFPAGLWMSNEIYCCTFTHLKNVCIKWINSKLCSHPCKTALMC